MCASHVLTRGPTLVTPICRWTDDIGGAIGQLTPLVEAARAQLRGDPGAGPQAVLRQMNEQLQQTGIPAIAQWEGCGLTSAGLRACAGCRAVQYCRWVPWGLQYRVEVGKSSMLGWFWLVIAADASLSCGCITWFRALP